jgi:BON domain
MGLIIPPTATFRFELAEAQLTSVPDSVEATASDGDITFTGTVRYGSERTAAEQALTYLTGVRDVKDDIMISTDADPIDVTAWVPLGSNKATL